MKVLYRLFCWSYQKQQWLLKSFTPGGLGLLLCLAATVIIGLDTKQTMAYQILTFLLAVLAIALFYSFFFRFRFEAQRNLPRFATVGVKLAYKITITNKTKQRQQGLQFIEDIGNCKLSLAEFERIKSGRNSLINIYFHWLKAIARERKATTKAISLPPLKPQGETVVKGEIDPTHRGVVRLKGISVLRSDPFNIYRGIRTINLPQSLLVLPHRYQLPVINLPGSRMSQSGTVSLASSVGDSEEFVSLRDYRPGDPLRNIHWKSWAKIDKPVIKEEQSEYFVRHALILDTFQFQSESEILEEAVSVAASFACDFYTQESLLDLMFVGLESYCFTSGRGLGDSEQMLEILAGVRACQDKSFDYLTAAVMERLSMLSGCICILIDWDEERKKLVQNLQRFDIPLLVLLLAEPNRDYSQINVANLHILFVDKVQESLMNVGG
ncbi:DUF58 domain-containing protein [Waterburya agarophytonicola K14]|uniref:DUF58 domain-containing protein n=1 Tax=Waterburya agarophytonicola KI4 TaxID=2874699 RepID=A0A964BS47_9CYAN|nr:DUF58 domain-containing protein [Waterburya agarophytonicola]MCC0177802.1 DUF58 domain-containing protein [Waterburya agarophytonicola KI4]